LRIAIHLSVVFTASSNRFSRSLRRRPDLPSSGQWELLPYAHGLRSTATHCADAAAA